MATKSTKRALLSAVLALIMTVSMLVGTTFAWFTDSVTSSGNKIVAGNLAVDLELLEKDNTTWTSLKETNAPIFNYDKWEPGFVDVKVLRVQNEGSLALKWVAKFVSSATLGKLADVIDVYVSTTVSAYPQDRAEIESWEKVGTVRDFVNTISDTTYGFLEAHTSANLGIALKMQDTAGNEYMLEDLGAFDITILATQWNKENDSFGPGYDLDADYDEPAQSVPTIGVSTAADLQAALSPSVSNDTAKVVLTSDIRLADGETWTPLDLEAYTTGVKNIIIEGQGHTIYGLNAPLIGHAYFGNTSIEINNLTLAEVNINNMGFNGLGSGAFVAYADNCNSVVINNCHLKDSTITAVGQGFTGIGGIVGYSSSNLTMIDCSVTNSTISGDGQSAGAIAGHVSAGYSTTITNAKVVDCTVAGERVDKSGYVVGTANNGATVITTKDCANNTVFGTANSTVIYGRLVGGTLKVNGVDQ